MVTHGVLGLLVVLVAAGVAGCSCGEIVVDRTHPGGVPDGGAAEGGTRADGGIDGADAGTSGPRSGSRIQVRGLQLGDTLVPTGVLWDSAQGVVCHPTLAADGTTRCLPGSRSQVWFTDDGCKNAVIVDQSPPDPCAAPDPHPYAIADTELACPPTGFTVYGKGAAVPAPATLYIHNRLGCGLVAGDQSGATFHAAVPSPASDWVRFRHDVTKVTDRLGVAYWDGTDGSRIMDGLRLLPDDIACGERDANGSAPVATTDASAAARCLPSNVVQLLRDYFTDGTCRDTVGLTLDCTPPDLVTGITPFTPGDAGSSPCGAGPRAPLFKAVAVPSTSVYTSPAGGSSDGGSCTPTPYGGFFYYGAGAEVRFEDYPLVTVLPSGTGRFQEIRTSSEGHELYAHPNELYDTKTATVCSAQDFGDGRTFCVSGSAIAFLDFVGVAGGSYSDATCSTPLAQVSVSCGASPAPVAAQVQNATGGQCAAMSLRRISGVHSGPAYANPFFGSFTACTRSAPSADTVLYDVGGAVDPQALFPLMTSQDL